MFICDHCHETVPVNTDMAVQNRNHCPSCLWSKHVDESPGDRKAPCQGLMEPLGLTFKKSKNKYKPDNIGELMLIHRCTACEKININRIAADDNADTILEVFVSSLTLSPELKQDLKKQHIKLLGKKEKKEILVQLFGVS